MKEFSDLIIFILKVMKSIIAFLYGHHSKHYTISTKGEVWARFRKLDKQEYVTNAWSYYGVLHIIMI
jgi:hypothetical protein